MRQYKTIVLQLLRQHPPVHNHLKQTRTLLPTLDHYSRELKTSHEDWTGLLSEQRPGSDPSQIASEAMELALRELEERLPAELLPDGSESLTTDRAIAHSRRHTPPA